jgi:DNA-binding MarR family transcriptional regulator
MPASAAPGEPPTAAAAVLAILKTSSWLLGELSPVFAEHGITAARFDVLDALSHQGAARPAELRDRLHLPAQTITGVLDQLQAAGLIRRTPHPADRRSTLAELTAAGHTAIAAVCPPLIEIEVDCLARLTPAEQRQLAGLLGRIQERITQRHAAAGQAPLPARTTPTPKVAQDL